MGGFVGNLLGTSKPSTAGQAEAARQSTDLERQIYEESVARGKPFYELGTAGVGQLQDLLGGGAFQERFGMEQFQEDPGYQFRLSEGEKALQRQLAAQGKTMSPEAVKALQSYGQEAASQEYGRAFDRYRAEEADMYNRLFNLANIGQGQAAQTQQAGQLMAGRVGETLTSLADAETAAEQAGLGRRASMFGTLTRGFMGGF